MKFSITIIAILLLPGCKSNNKTQLPKAALPASAEALQNVAGCYLMTIGKDSAFMRLHKDKDSIKGMLAYQPFEKDKRQGKVSFKQDSRYLTGWYYFKSEGRFSIQQVRFRITEDGLEEGYGQLTYQDDSMLFKNSLNVINFESQHPFKKITCR
ncbi:MAG: hypothetical protein WAT19_01000 [Ferruginibacter sp.]